jgi:hypothetical protein
VNSWDIEIVGTRLIIREASRNTLFDIRFVPPAKVVVKRGRFLRNGIELLITPNWCAFLNNCFLFQRVGIINCGAGLILGEDATSMGAVFRFSGIPREGWDRASAIRWARQAAAGSQMTAAVLNDLLSATSLDSPG